MQSIEELQEKGFTIIKSAVDKRSLQGLKNLTEDVITYSEKGFNDPFSTYYLEHRVDQGVLYDLFQRHPEFQPLASLPSVIGVLQGVLGKNIILYENSLVYKPKGKSNAVPWHQDFISRPKEPKKFIAWIALDDVHDENGPLKVIPSSHLDGYQAWHRVKGQTHHDRINPRAIDENRAVEIHMNSGDALIFDAMLIHGSDECHSGIPRRAYRISYQNFDSIHPPRGTPIVVSGGNTVFFKEYDQITNRKKPYWKKFLNKIGKRLIRI